jgi:hypothetical protein
MHSKLAGHLPLQDMIAATLESARSKIAAAEEKDKEKSDKVKKLVDYEKKEHGGKIPSVKEEEDEHKEKKSSAVLDFDDPDSMEKLAEALDELGEELLKQADSVENGKESKQGGEQLATQSPTGGKQVYTGAKATAKHQVTAGGVKATKDNPGAATANETDENRAPGGNGAKYPDKGVLKTGAAALQAVVAEIAQEKRAGAGETVMKGLGKAVGTTARVAGNHPHLAATAGGAAVGGVTGAIAGGPGNRLSGAGKGALTGAVIGGGGSQLRERAAEALAKNPHFLSAAGEALSKKGSAENSAVGFILNKLAEFQGGGEVLNTGSVAIPSNEGRQLIANNSAPVSATKREAKSPGRKQLSEVLTEPAQTASTDNTVQQNLRNASKGGVKIAAVKSYLRKVSEAGCVCNGQGECDYCRMKSSVEKKRAEKKVKQSLGMPPMGPAPAAGGPMGGPKMM